MPIYNAQICSASELIIDELLIILDRKSVHNKRGINHGT